VPVHTVLGPIEPSALGMTSMHEHVLINASVLFIEPPTAPPHGDTVCIENLGFLRYNTLGLRDNLIVDDAELITRELSRFRTAGGSTVVDMTNIGLGRQVDRLPAISRAAGVDIVIGCGWYLHASHPPELDTAAPEQLAEALVSELRDGVGDTGIRPGLIGEVGTSAPVTERERKVLRASAWAAVETGAAINCHIEAAGAHGVEVAELLIAEGAAPDRIVLSHMDERLDLDYHLAAASLGVVLEFDTFGVESYWNFPAKDPTDAERCEQLATLLEQGLAAQVVLGCDVFTKTCHTEFGGMGYEHLPLRVAPMLRDNYGVTGEQLDQMLVETPRRLLDRPWSDA